MTKRKNKSSLVSQSQGGGASAPVRSNGVRQPPGLGKSRTARRRRRLVRSGKNDLLSGLADPNSEIGYMPKASRPDRIQGRSVTAKEYKDCLADPFCAPVGKLGFGTFVPTSLHSSWSVVTYTTTEPNFAIDFMPFFTVGATYFPIRVFALPTASQALNSATPTNYGMVNGTSLGTLCQTGRIVTAGIRVNVRYAATAIQGRIGGNFLPDESVNNTENISIGQHQSLSGYRDFHAVQAGGVGGQVAYRPDDNSKFEFTPDMIVGPSSGTSVYPRMVIVGSGFPTPTGAGAGAQYAVDIQVYVVEETLGGADTSGEDNYTPPNFSIDEASNIIASLPPPVTPNISAIDMLDSAMNNINRASARYGGFGGVMRGQVRALHSRTEDNFCRIEKPVNFSSSSTYTPPQK